MLYLGLSKLDILQTIKSTQVHVVLIVILTFYISVHTLCLTMRMHTTTFVDKESS